VLSANSNIAAAFATPSPSYFGIGELGGGYSDDDIGQTTQSSSIHLTVDLNQLAVREDLLIGLYDPDSTGDGFSNLDFIIRANGTTLSTYSFTDTATATNFFTNNALDLGSLAGYGSTLNLDLILSLTTQTPGSSFEFNMLIGDPPPGTSQGSSLSATDNDADHIGQYLIGGAQGGQGGTGSGLYNDPYLDVPPSLDLELSHQQDHNGHQ